MPCHRAVPGGIVISVRLTPKAAQNSLDGIGSLADGAEVAMARVRALPADGAANKALIAVLAKALKVPKSAVAIVSGAGSRLKKLKIVGDVPAIASDIDKWRRLS
jgi:uncharacterized protein